MKQQISFKRSAPTILTFLGAVGVVSTAVLTAQATLKASKKLEKERQYYPEEQIPKDVSFKLVWSYYIPPLVSGTSTIVCILGANVLSKHQQASLASAYALVSNSYHDYKNKVKEICGEETHQRIIDELMVEKAEDIYVTSDDIIGVNALAFDTRNPDDNRLFYDCFSKRYFESTVAQVLEAEYHLNRNWILGDDISINTFYEFLGLSPMDGGDDLNWFWIDGISWIDFNHHKAILDDGLEVYVIELQYEPRLETYNDY